ncbi:Hsp70 family protein [Parachlamydia sp. AcF125]|uniref:Hsp70 family protein n=1 Tax=Parachlamydia sp. AcF125 TaxID=2795736 RepID=UPI001BC97F87|nr:Hsp70 family protein [Parachlamydia sp. AcF125]MBS4167986.1 Chaperone protein DnaK [Parachlamydia sp. AcF125]
MRYIIGIDLGTTNSCVSYVDTYNPKLAVETFRIPQLTAVGFVEAQSILPSFCYLSLPHEWPVGSFDLPWKKDSQFAVGKFAQIQGEKTPNRSVQSAKSWLCHSSASRRDKILPFETSEGIEKISPVTASSRYLQHIREAWNFLMGKGNPEDEFESQEIILTVPASFDEVARSLTVEAAKQAGFISMTLLEEPQAAFYCWISAHEKKWQQRFKKGDCILVCDVGGGTTDFSLIEVVTKEEQLAFQRMAVGDHLLLGGDNMDAALAYYLENKLQIELTPLQRLQLNYQAKHAKEQLLEATVEEGASYACVLQGTGSKVIQGSRHIPITKKEVEKLLGEGFFQVYPWEEAIQLKRGTSFRTMGLPYEAEPSITKHLAHFLQKASSIRKEMKSPNFVLVNGGTMKPSLFQKAVMDSLAAWFPQQQVELLTSPSLDLAVSRGAAYYGKARRGLGVKIAGGVPRGYYLGIEAKAANETSVFKALCLLPRGSEEGAHFEPTETFWLLPNKPVSFQLYSSEVRLEDQQGELIEVDPKELHPLPPIHTILRFGKSGEEQKIPVRLQISLTAIGTLELWLRSEKTAHEWALEFQVRTAAGQEDSLLGMQKARSDEIYDRQFLKKGNDLLVELFTGLNQASKEIMEKLENVLEKPRAEWSPSILRNFWATLAAQAPQRKRSEELEKRWWNLAGYLLRPGFGYPLDDFRIKDLWKIILEDFKRPKGDDVQIQMWICFRRIAGGLSKGQQIQLSNELLAFIWNKRTHTFEIKGRKFLYQYAEKIRALASFEWLDVPLKIKLGEALLKRIIAGEGEAYDYWALGRIGARHLFYGSSAHVVPREICTGWVKTLLSLDQKDLRPYLFAILQLARKTNHPELNLANEVIQQVERVLDKELHAVELKRLLQNEGMASQEDRDRIFGEQLPHGLTMELS